MSEANVNDTERSFPPRLPESDRIQWHQMTANQRAIALARIEAFDGWLAKKQRIDDCVAASGLSKSRFYRLAAEWREMPCLNALGAQRGSGGGGKKLNSDAVNALQAVLPDLVRMNVDASVSQLGRLAIDAVKLRTESLPKTSRLRQMVEHEMRNQRSLTEAGTIIKFDMTAISLAQKNGRPFIMVCCIDAGTTALLGTAVIEEPLAQGSYKLVAENALTRIQGDLARLPWSDRFLEADMTSGVDLDASIEMVAHLDTQVRANVQRASSPKRFGKYIRDLVGTKLGKIYVTRARTQAGVALTNNKNMMPWSIEEARIAVKIATDEHNAKILAEGKLDGFASPPDDLLKLLSLLAD